MALSLPDWSGRTVVLVGSGRSAAQADLSRVVGIAPVLVINEGWRLCPFADVLYACDGKWWRERGPRPEQFGGLRVTQDTRAARDLGLVPVAVDPHGVEITTEGPMGAGGNSGFQAVNLAVRWGAKRLVLVGFDYQGEHWHGRHPEGLNNPTEAMLARWARALDANAGRLADLGVEVAVCGPSALTAFPTTTLEEQFPCR